jgi:hypothetical protein
VLVKVLFKNAKEISRRYYDIIQLSSDNNKEFRDRVNREISKLNNRPVAIDDSEILSDIDDQKLSRVFQRLNAFKDKAKSKKPEDEEMLKEVSKSKERDFEDTPRSKDSYLDKSFERELDETPDIPLEDREPKDLEPFKMPEYKQPEEIKRPRFEEIEEEDQEDQEAIEERKRKEAEEREWMAKYIDTETGEPFNPIKKFGLIENDYLVYDNVTSSYPLNLPTDYYQRYIKSTIPSKKQKNWFIRPHHVEKLTTHVKSIKDDVLNTQYYSHYYDESKNKSKKDDLVVAIDGLEDKIGQIKDYIKMVKMNNGTWDPDEEDILYSDPDLNKEARRRFENFLYDGKREDKKKLLIETFEALLYEKRRIEKEMLNVKRAREYEKNRPPQDRWYELKSEEFNKELYRNRMALKPNNQNKVYLNNLQDPYLY